MLLRSMVVSIIALCTVMTLSQILKADPIDQIVSGEYVPREDVLVINNPTFNGASLIILYSAEAEKMSKINELPDDTGYKTMLQKANWQLEDTRALAFCQAMHYSTLKYRDMINGYGYATGLWTINPATSQFLFVQDSPTEAGYAFTYLKVLICGR